ncbi:MAG: GntR family transcriptional regulator [Anaerolineales bacterium]|nr:GntR family transcriptional regulator [Anaerolineales bacterium]
MLPTSLLTVQRRQRGENGSQSAEAYARIREKIINLELPPAAPIDENALIGELGLGRTPIREAIQRLALENLVVVYPRRGTLVADLNLSDLQKIFELRLELEPFAARLAAERASVEQIAAMQTLFASADEILLAGNNRQLIELDHRAHELLAQAAHNEFLEETLERLYGHVLRLWYVSLNKVSRLREAIEEHRDIITAIQARDGDRAASIMRAHVSGFQSEFLSASQ